MSRAPARGNISRLSQWPLAIPPTCPRATGKNHQSLIQPVQLNGTYQFIKQLLARVLQALSALLDPFPRIHHPCNFSVDLVDVSDESLTHVEVVRDAQQVLPKVRLLAVCDRTIYQREPVVELLRSLHCLRQVKCVRMRDGWCTRERCGRARA